MAGAAGTTLRSYPRSARTPLRRSVMMSAPGGFIAASTPPSPTRQGDQSDRGGLDALLRPVLPVGVVSAPGPHQHLLGALDPQEIQTATGDTQGKPVPAADRPYSAPA